MVKILRGRSDGGEVRTSESHPIRVDFLGVQPWQGRLGVTFAPGKKNESYQRFTWERDLEADLQRLFTVFGTEVLVTVLEKEEMEWMGIPDLRERAREAGMESLYFSIMDLSAPAEDDLCEFLDLLGEILVRLDAGKTVVVHCRGGLGRSGMLAACLLVLRGYGPQEALVAVREARGEGAVEMPEQEDFIETVARAGLGD